MVQDHDWVGEWVVWVCQVVWLTRMGECFGMLCGLWVRDQSSERVSHRIIIFAELHYYRNGLENEESKSILI